MFILRYRQRQYPKRRFLRIFCFIHIENEDQFQLLSRFISVLRSAQNGQSKKIALYRKNTHIHLYKNKQNIQKNKIRQKQCSILQLFKKIGVKVRKIYTIKQNEHILTPHK